MTRPFRKARPAREAEPVQQLDVYLVGTAYSGTTHLGGLLAANFGSFYAGELGRLPGYVERYKLFADPVGCLRCAGEGHPCPVWTDSVVAEVEAAGPPLLMRRLRELTGASVIIDGSKLPAWLQATLNGRDGADARMVILLTTRSPLSYAMSALGATGQPLWLALREWRDIYIDAMRTATRTQLPIFVVRNEEVRADPATVLDRLAPVLGWPDRVRQVAPPLRLTASAATLSCRASSSPMPTASCMSQGSPSANRSIPRPWTSSPKPRPSAPCSGPGMPRRPGSGCRP